jgi:hypothetical protein
MSMGMPPGTAPPLHPSQLLEKTNREPPSLE